MRAAKYADSQSKFQAGAGTDTDTAQTDESRRMTRAAAGFRASALQRFSLYWALQSIFEVLVSS